MGKYFQSELKRNLIFWTNPTVFVEFETEEEAIKFLSCGPKKWDQFDLTVIQKENYMQTISDKIKHNLVIFLEDLPENLDWRLIKTLFNQFGSNYSDIHQNACIAYIQFNNPNAALRAFKELEKKNLKIEDKVLKGSLLTGVEEIHYWLFKSRHPPISGKINKCKRKKKPEKNENTFQSLVQRATEELKKTQPTQETQQTELKLNINHINTC